MINILEPSADITVQSLARGLQLLEIISSCPDGIGITSLSEKTNLSKSTVHRLLQTLKSLDYVTQEIDTGKYKVGLKVLALYNNAISELDVKYIAHRYLKQLRNSVNESVQLAVQNGTQAVYIDKIESERSIRMYSKIGKSIPLYCSSAGKALVAWKPEEYIRELMKNESFEPFTKNTISNIQDFIDELCSVRVQGYATDWFEHEDHVFCVGSPIFDYSNNAIAAVSVAGIVFSFTDAHYHDICLAVFNTAKEISSELGCIEYPISFNFVSRFLNEKDSNSSN